MLYYELPSGLSRDIKQFENEIEKYRSGKLHEVSFIAKRVKMGVYLERGALTYMCRIRCSGNVVIPDQLVKIADLARRYGDDRVHVTTRSELQIHHVKLDDTLPIIRELINAGLTMKGGGGHTIRNIWTNCDSGVNPKELFDVQPHAIALTGRLIDEADSFDLPRKFKITFSSMIEDAANCTFQDLGFIAAIGPKGKRGFKVYAGGGLGAKPRIGILLHEFIPEDKVYHVVRSVKNLFLSHGNRKDKNHSRIRFLVHDDLGRKRFRDYYNEELDSIYRDDSKNLSINPIDNKENLDRQIDLDQMAEAPEGYEIWRNRYVMSQKQVGLFYIRLPLILGDLDSEDCYRLAETLRPFGDNVLRCCTDQNLHVRNIPERFLKNVYNGLKSLRTLTDKPVIYGDIVPCTGAQTCQVGINFPRPAVQAVFKFFKETGLNFDGLGGMKIRISGCPNSCSNHWIGDLGFYGKVRRVGARPIPTYNVLGGSRTDASEIRLGVQVGWIHSKDLPRFLADVLQRFQGYKEGATYDMDFNQFWRNRGREYIANLCKERFNRIPSFDEDMDYYFDHGAKELFSIKTLEKAECSAGIYNMIDVDKKEIKNNLKVIETWKGSRRDLHDTLKEMVFFASRMLLVTRGEEPRTEQESHDLFLKHFIDTGLMHEKHRHTVEMARNEESDELSNHRDMVIALGKEIITLYDSMDNAMHFPGEALEPAIDMEKPRAKGPEVDTGGKNADKFKDLRGVKCPINFAKAKVQLATMKSGQLLEIVLDDGEPIENVPRSVILEGHKVLKQERNGEHWNVMIEKA